MTDERIEGVARQGMGRVQDAVGGLTGNGRAQAEGKFNEAMGAAQDAYGQVKDRARDAYGQARDRAQDAYGQAQDILGELETYAREQPLKALAAGAAVGLLVGLLLRGGRKTVYVRR